MNKVTYSVSCRGKEGQNPIEDFLNMRFPDIDKTAIDMVFGFVERSTLYGGRQFIEPEISQDDVEYLYRYNMGLKLVVSNHFVTEEEYAREAAFLDKYHRKGNAVVIVNDDLAKWIKRDFPLYEVEASVIKNIRNQRQIDKYLELYDTIVLPMNLHKSPGKLSKFEPKNRLRLFSNAGCAYNCPAKTCYEATSKINKLMPGAGVGKFVCSQQKLFRPSLGFIHFDVDQLNEIGYTKFKTLRARAPDGTGF